MKKVLVTGANGQLGLCLRDAVNAMNDKNFEFLFMDRNLLDISNANIVESYFFTNSIDVVVNCAAYTAVDQAEVEIENAFRVNADAVALLAKECKEQGADFIHISTDYVFNGEGDKPFKENHPTEPLNVYGKSKYEGERLAQVHNPDSIIIRTAWVYSQYKKNFLKTMLRLFDSKDEIFVVNDQHGTPTNANDIANAILKILKAEKRPAGIYHYTNAGQTTWLGFAKAIKEITESEIEIKGIPTSAYPTPAKRPKYSVLDTQKIANEFGVDIPEWKDSLKDLILNKF